MNTLSGPHLSQHQLPPPTTHTHPFRNEHSQRPPPVSASTRPGCAAAANANSNTTAACGCHSHMPERTTRGCLSAVGTAHAHPLHVHCWWQCRFMAPTATLAPHGRCCMLPAAPAHAATGSSPSCRFTSAPLWARAGGTGAPGFVPWASGLKSNPIAVQRDDGRNGAPSRSELHPSPPPLWPPSFRSRLQSHPGASSSSTARPSASAAARRLPPRGAGAREPQPQGAGEARRGSG
eukprot:366560-Chlamydomonas_euryale.AAC.5